MTFKKLFVILAAVSLFSVATMDAGTGTRYSRYTSMPSRLLIHRAANFGTFISVNVYIDGVYAGNVAYNHDLDALVPAGSHVVTLEQTPRRGAALQTTQQRIEVAADGSSIFTLMSADGGTRAVLRRS